MSENHCDKHNIDIDKLPSGYDYCPRCRQEESLERRQAERMTRHAPRSVDDPAPIESYRH